MLHQLAPREITSFGAQQTAEFKIKASGKAFRILIDGLYSDKVTAVVRELISNAIDSHTAAQNDQPITIRVPTSMNPTFSVRDYGVGMSHETVMSNYSTLFDSSKEDDDSQIGKLGLGSKSPFAYTDAFNLQCWDGASVRRYMVYINDSHVPVIDYVGSEESDEPRGVEVALAVEPSAFSDFERAVKRIARDLTVTPDLLGTQPITPPELLSEGPGWRLYEESNYTLAVYARQGQITYAVDTQQVLAKFNLLKSISATHRRLVLDFPPNTLGFTASREQLEYTPETVVRISDALDSYASHILDKYRQMLRDTRSRWELAHYINNNSLGAIFNYLHNTLGELHFGQKISNYFTMPKGMAFLAQGYDMTSRRSTVSYPTFRKNATTPHAISPTNVLYFYDTRKPEKNVPERIYEDMLRRRRTQYGVDRAILIRYSSDNQLRRILVALGRPQKFATDVSTLPEVQRVDKNGIKREYTNGGVLKYNGIERCKIDLKAGGYYIVGVRDDIFINGVRGAASPSAVVSFWEAITHFSDLPSGTPLHVFTPSQAEKLTDRPEWIKYDDMVVGLHRRFADRVAIARRLTYSSLGSLSANIEKLVDHVDQLGDNVDPRFGTALPRIVAARREYETLKNTYSKFDRLARVFSTFGTSIEQDMTLRLPQASSLQGGVFDEFPLLRYVGADAPTELIVNTVILR